MLVQIVQIGNSKGVRIPASVLQQFGSDRFELSAEKDQIVLKPQKTARANWGNLFAADPAKKDDLALLPDTLEEDLEGWEWK